MRLIGTVRAKKDGIFTPEDSSERIPWALLRVRDQDSGEDVKVKPPVDELLEFTDFMKDLSRGDTVELTVLLDRFGNLRLVLPEQD